MSARTFPLLASIIGAFTPDKLRATVPWGWLGWAQMNGNLSGVTSETDMTGLSVTVTVGTNRLIRVTGTGFTTLSAADGGWAWGLIRMDGTQIGTWAFSDRPFSDPQERSVILTPTPGAHTFKMTLQKFSGTTATAGTSHGADDPGFLVIEDLGPAS